MKTPDDLLSVIIPIYNTKEYLPRCLDSILDQTYPSLEIICVDDGSTDGSAELLDDYATKDSRIQVLHKSNGGPSSARKAGLSHATGIYTTFVDSDDWVDADMYKDLMEGIRLHDATVAYPGLSEIMANARSLTML